MDATNTSKELLKFNIQKRYDGETVKFFKIPVF